MLESVTRVSFFLIRLAFPKNELHNANHENNNGKTKTDWATRVDASLIPR
jgi:hypothetical protein